MINRTPFQNKATDQSSLVTDLNLHDRAFHDGLRNFLTELLIICHLSNLQHDLETDSNLHNSTLLFTRTTIISYSTLAIDQTLAVLLIVIEVEEECNAIILLNSEEM